MSYIKGKPRGQSVLFPRSLDEYLDENNAVRAIEAFIEYLRFDELGFVRGSGGDGPAWL
jgi:transposase